MRSSLPTLVALLLLGVPAHAALQWTKSTIEMDAEPFAERIETTFVFTNVGPTDVTITDTHASCGCTVPTLERRTYHPKETGELHVVYTFGEAVGHLEKTVTVSTDEPANPSYLLTLRVNVPALFDVQPRFVLWQHDEAPTAKTITIRALHPDLAHPTAVESKNARFTVSLAASADVPNTYTVTVTPTQTNAAMFTSITVTTTAPAEKKRVIQLFATVR